MQSFRESAETGTHEGSITIGNGKTQMDFVGTYSATRICRRIPRFSTNLISVIPSLMKINGARWKIASSIFWLWAAADDLGRGKSYVLPLVKAPRWRVRFQKIC